MPIMEGETIVAANALSANVFAGESHEFLHSDAAVDFYATGSAAGLRHFLTATPDEIARDAVLNAANRAPVEPDDRIASETIAGGTRLDWRFRNTTVGALTARWRARVQY